MAKIESESREDQFIEKLVSVRRVTKVVKGGKNLRFSALVIVGDGKGRVGYATGKAREVPEAVRKATDRAKKTMVRIPLREGRTLHHDVYKKEGAGVVCLRSAPAGTGVIAGGAMRSLFEALGVQDIVAKCIGSSNYHNSVHATLAALRSMAPPRYVANKLGKKLSEITARRQRLPKSSNELVLAD